MLTPHSDTSHAEVQTVDREIFVGSYDSGASLKTNAKQFGLDLVDGGFIHEKHVARVVTAWNQAEVAGPRSG